MKYASLLKLAGAMLLAASLAGTTKADPITGTITFAGSVVLDSSISTATTVISFNNGHVETRSGDFANPVFLIDVNTPTTFATNWNFASNGAQLALWSVGGFTFDLASSTTVIQQIGSNTLWLNVDGIGTISGNGFDPTVGYFSFATSDSGITGGTSFSFQATGVAVPDGSTTALLVGFGLVGMSFVARRRK